MMQFSGGLQDTSLSLYNACFFIIVKTISQ